MMQANGLIEGIIRRGRKTKPIAEGSQIVVELNEAGPVIDLWKAQ